MNEKLIKKYKLILPVLILGFVISFLGIEDKYDFITGILKYSIFIGVIFAAIALFSKKK